MAEKVIFFIILAILWVMIVFNRKLKSSVRKTEQDLLSLKTEGGWGVGDCPCGTGRNGWRALAMNKPDNNVLLICTGCASLWEEHMSLYGNKWRPVDEAYAKEQYGYSGSEHRRKLVDQ